MLPRLRTNIKDGVAAPHKPILLLAVLKAYEKGILHSNRIPLSPELVSLFKQIWGYLVVTNHHPNISYPFFHLSGDKFWRLIPKTGMDDIRLLEAKARNLSTLDAVIDYALIDSDLATKMMQPSTRAALVEAILAKYFPHTRAHYDAQQAAPDLLAGMDKLLLETPSLAYRQEMNTLFQAAEDEAIYLRSAAFKRIVPQVYNYTCAVTRWRLTSSKDDQILDACHIIPFAETHDDTIQNGIALSPTLHRAFDRGLITISDDYHVIVSPHIQENDIPHALKHLHEREILLPNNPSHRPSIDNLRQHRLRHVH